MTVVRVGVDTPPVVLQEGNGHLSAKKLGILRAMRYAILVTKPGDVIVQSDMEWVGQGGRLPSTPGSITTLDVPVTDSHTCPRAFVVPDDETRLTLIAAWCDETRTACDGWAAIPKVRGPIEYHHPRPRPRGTA